MKRLLLSILAVWLLFVASAAAAAHTGAGAITVHSRQQLDNRLTEYRLATSALPAPTIVRVLLPTGYAQHPARRYPVLYVLHGCCDFDEDGAQAWTTHGDAEHVTAGKNVIVVMPAGGRGGMYSNWQTPGLEGRPRWETYHVGQLIPWIDQTFRTVPGRQGRAIAGLSMGGLGAMKYAALYPDRFIAAASFSGIVDTNVDGGAIPALLPTFDGGTPASVWGPRLTSELRWRSENPWDLAENLRPLQLTLRTGKGQAGPYDDGRGDAIEAGAERNSISLHRRLHALGIDHVWDDYGPGTHTWPYWTRDLRETLPALLAAFAHPPAPPARVTYTSARPGYSVFGWRVEWRRNGLAFTKLSGATQRGLVLSGAGTARIRTPPHIAKGARVRVDGSRVPARRDAVGRLTFTVNTGADHHAVIRFAHEPSRQRTRRKTG